MRIFGTVMTSLSLLGAPLLAQEVKTNHAAVKITAFQAKDFIGTNAVVIGKIVEVNKTARIVRLNLDEAFPKQPFTAIIFWNHTNLFPDLEKLKDKSVEISGKISDYHGRPEIEITSTNQLMVVEKPTGKS